MKWYDASVCHPSSSREVLIARVCCGKISSIQSMGYSVKYHSFNAYDGMDNAENSVEVDFWADMPTVEDMQGE